MPHRRNGILPAWHTDAITRLVKEIRDRGYSGKFTLTTAECHDRIFKAFEEEHYARGLEELKSGTDASK